jgi:hypothetical protein
VKFRAGELEFNASVAEAAEVSSPRTGDRLRTLTIQFRAQKEEMHQQALAQAQQRQTGGLYSLADGGQPDLEWRVRESASQYVGSEPWGINHHVWRIEQVERLACERLIVESVGFEPYDYAEDVAEEGLVRLAARALASAADLEALARVAEAADVAVVRVGISDRPRRMRLSYVWGERPEGLVAVIRCEDVREPRVDLSGATGAVWDADLQRQLLGVLQERGVLDEATMAELRRRRHAARRVSDVDGWRL